MCMHYLPCHFMAFLMRYVMIKFKILDLPRQPLFDGWGGGAKLPIMSKFTIDYPNYIMCKIVFDNFESFKGEGGEGGYL